VTLTSRRQPPSEDPTTVANQDWNGSRLTVAKWLKWAKAYFSSIPGGWGNLTPTTITPDATGAAGDENKSWAASNHTHAIATDTAAPLGGAESEGTATSFSRSDHIHKRKIETTQGGYIRRRLNFKTGFTVTDDAAADEIEVEVSSAVAGGGPRSALPNANDYVLHRATHLESYIVAITTGKI
jgi:hypothetical protein